MVGGEWLEVIATTAQVTITTGHHKHELVLIFFLFVISIRLGRCYALGVACIGRIAELDMQRRRMEEKARSEMVLNAG